LPHRGNMLIENIDTKLTQLRRSDTSPFKIMSKINFYPVLLQIRV
jgi:hypothetical protein